jgi:hypothetical protein
VCLGETIAKDTLFIFFATLLKLFSFERIPYKDLPTTEPVVGVTLRPQPFDVLVNNRQFDLIAT